MPREMWRTSGWPRDAASAQLNAVRHWRLDTAGEWRWWTWWNTNKHNWNSKKLTPSWKAKSSVSILKSSCQEHTMWNANGFICVPSEQVRPVCQSCQPCCDTADLWSAQQPEGKTWCADGTNPGELRRQNEPVEILGSSAVEACWWSIHNRNSSKVRTREENRRKYNINNPSFAKHPGPEYCKMMCSSLFAAYLMPNCVWVAVFGCWRLSCPFLSLIPLPWSRLWKRWTKQSRGKVRSLMPSGKESPKNCLRYLLAAFNQITRAFFTPC